MLPEAAHSLLIIVPLTCRQTRAAFLMTSAIEPRRLALRYTPPGIIVEYAHSISRFPRQLYHHEIDLQGVVQSSRQRDARERPSSVDEIVKTLIEQHGQVLGDRKVSSRQVFDGAAERSILLASFN